MIFYLLLQGQISISEFTEEVEQKSLIKSTRQRMLHMTLVQHGNSRRISLMISLISKFKVNE